MEAHQREPYRYPTKDPIQWPTDTRLLLTEACVSPAYRRLLPVKSEASPDKAGSVTPPLNLTAVIPLFNKGHFGYRHGQFFTSDQSINLCARFGAMSIDQRHGDRGANRGAKST